MRKTQILLDMDGVLTDLIGDMIPILNQACDKSFTVADYVKYADYNISKFYSMSHDTCWKIIEQQEYFWLNMTAMPWFDELYDTLCSLGDVTILTTPVSDPKCAYQKLQWLAKRDVSSESIMIGSRKYLTAGNGILIDDYSKNIDSFKEAGGQAILVPSTWNTPNLTFEQVWKAIEDGFNSF